MEVRVKSITWEAPGIHTYELVPLRPEPLPPFTAGAHIDVILPGGVARQYSLHNPPRERHRYLVSVLHLPAGRGGSDALHRNTKAGDILAISEPRNHFELIEGAARYVLVAGGIGVTPLIAMVARLAELQADHVLHYCCRSRDSAAFSAALEPLVADGRVVFHEDGGVPGNGLNVMRLFSECAQGTQVYCCGPAGLMSAVRTATSHWPAGTVHFESFSAPALSAPPPGVAGEVEFEVELASTGRVIPVPHHQTMLEALRAHGVDLDSSCEAGTCGTCMTRYCEGEPDHQDYILGAEEQQEFLMVCVSRSKSRRIKLDL
ncbi:MAG: iron-sulfur protein [Herminiimonas sp.]|nr:iron-sulfur protein [Herminiimonas sp.]